MSTYRVYFNEELEVDVPDGLDLSEQELDDMLRTIATTGNTPRSEVSYSVINSDVSWESAN